MYEKVNPAHPDKVADRIAGAIVDIAYKHYKNPRIAVEVLIGHGYCFSTIECSEGIGVWSNEIDDAIHRITKTTEKELQTIIVMVPQDTNLSKAQENTVRCGDNGIFRGVPITAEQAWLSDIAHDIYEKYGTDGKYIVADGDLIICQSNAPKEELERDYEGARVNPLGDWTGGTDVDTGCNNRKLGSDMGDAVTGGGLHGKDCTKADVSLNIYAHMRAMLEGKPVELHCAIGDEVVDGKPYSEIVAMARQYIKQIGGFEKFAEWGLIR